MAPPEVHVFVSPGVKPDVRLKVFNKEFHVHSFILKHNSAFFRKFLDSPDKKPLASPPAPFKYEWVTTTDNNHDNDDGLHWFLVAATKDTPNDVTASFSDTTKRFEVKAFHCLLIAMYGRPYNFNNTSSISCLVKVADYYCALPLVTSTLTSYLHASKFELELKDSLTLCYLAIATKLRHAGLFRDCAIILIGRWHIPYPDGIHKMKKEDEQTRDLEIGPKTWRALDIVHESIKRKLNDAYQELMNRQALSYDNKKIRLITVPSTEDGTGAALPSYFRQVLNAGFEYEDIPYAYECPIRQLMRSNVIFHVDENLREDARAGEGDYKEYFLCGEIDDKDLPWDTTQEDW